MADHVMLELRTADLLIRPPAPEDAPEAFELMTDQPWEEPPGPERDRPIVIAEWKPDVME